MEKKQVQVLGLWRWLVGWSFNHLVIFLVFMMFTLALYCNHEIGGVIGRALDGNNLSSTTCNLFSGRWVFDNKSLPLYRDWNCSTMFGDLACESYGRKDLNYQYWRWQPHNCDLPKFEAKRLLENLSNKRIMFVGDSLNRNQWVSFICLIESAIPPSFRSRNFTGNLYSFFAKGYNVTIDFYWAPFLLESNSDDPSNHHLKEQIVRMQSIEKHAKHWTDANILVFNSYLWWRQPSLKVLKGSFENPNAVYQEMEFRKCYKMALETWSKWVLSHVNSRKTRLFWISMSPTHTRSENWGMTGDKQCFNETQLTAEEQLRGSEIDPQIMRLTERAIENLNQRGFKIHLLNITQLSEYRKDGHPTFYKKIWTPLTKEKLANPFSYIDCTHWCLPGVPDVWNHILYAYLI